MAGFGVDVLDPAVTPRRIAVLAARVPPFARRGGEWWSTEAELLALLIDHVANLTWVTARAAGAKGAQRPRPITRPGPVVLGAGSSAPRSSAPATPPGSTKTGTWAEAIGILAGMPGVKVDRG